MAKQLADINKMISASFFYEETNKIFLSFKRAGNALADAEYIFLSVSKWSFTLAGQ